MSQSEEDSQNISGNGSTGASVQDPPSYENADVDISTVGEEGGDAAEATIAAPKKSKRKASSQKITVEDVPPPKNIRGPRVLKDLRTPLEKCLDSPKSRDLDKIGEAKFRKKHNLRKCHVRKPNIVAEVNGVVDDEKEIVLLASRTKIWRPKIWRPKPS